MAAWRNVRLNFYGKWGEVFAAFYLCQGIGMAPFGLMMPWALKQQDEFIYRNIGYGGKPVICNIEVGRYFVAGYGAALCALLIIVPTFNWVGTTKGVLDPKLLVVSGAILVAYALATSVYKTIVRNQLFIRTFLPGLVDCKSKVEILPLFWLLLANGLMLVCTLGLALPWVRVRTARYYADAASVRMSDEIESVIAKLPQEASAVGEEVAGIFDMDASLT